MALRDLVKDVHDRAERSPFAKLLMSGEIPELQYANYLYQQKIMYRGLENHADHLGILKDIPHIKRHQKISFVPPPLPLPSIVVAVLSFFVPTYYRAQWIQQKAAFFKMS